MTLNEINHLWETYKREYGLDSDVKVTGVEFEESDFIEGYFNIMEMLEGKYILHINSMMNKYDEEYARFILYHEFTHFYDFLKRPYDNLEKTLLYMNSYSEYHACKLTLEKAIREYRVDKVDIDKKQIPGPFAPISIRQLVEETYWKAKMGFNYYQLTLLPGDFATAFRILMYQFGFLSLFERDDALVKHTIRMLGLNEDRIFPLYDAMREKRFDDVVSIFRSIGDEIVLRYIRAMFRQYVDPDVLSDEEIEEITLENYQDYVKKYIDEEETENWQDEEKAAYVRLFTYLMQGGMKA